MNRHILYVRITEKRRKNMTTKNTKLVLPTGDSLYPLEEKTALDIYKPALTLYAIETIGKEVSNDDEYVQNNMNALKSVKMDSKGRYAGDTIFEDGTLYLPGQFFKRQIESLDDLIYMIDEYPDLGELLRIYSIFIISKKDIDSREDVKLKQLLSSYYAGKYIGEPKDVCFAGLTFASEARANALQSNIIQQLDLVFGDTVMLNALKYGTSSFTHQVDIATKKPGLGGRLLENLLGIDSHSKRQLELDGHIEVAMRIMDSVIRPLYSSTKGLKKKDQRERAERLIFSDYDLSTLGVDYPDGTRPLSEDEKNLIERYCQIFDREFDNLELHLATEFPPVEPYDSLYFARGTRYAAHDFTEINKFLTIFGLLLGERDSLNKLIAREVKGIEELIMFDLIPKYIKSHPDAEIDLEEIWKLGTFTGKYPVHLKTDIRTKFIYRPKKN